MSFPHVGSISMKLLLLAALLILLESAEAPAATTLPGIKGTDDRVLIDSVEAPWGAIGRLNREGGGFCTGVAVGRRTVLTAAHCLWNPRTGRWGGAETIHFLAGYRRGEWLQHARVASYRTGGPLDGSRDGPRRNPARDWAILELSEELGPRVTPLELGTFDEANTEILQAGYSQNTPHMLTVDRECRVTPAGAGLLTHDCDATHGDSGAPLLRRRKDGRYEVVGIHIGNADGGTVGIAISGTEILARRGD